MLNGELQGELGNVTQICYRCRWLQCSSSNTVHYLMAEEGGGRYGGDSGGGGFGGSSGGKWNNIHIRVSVIQKVKKIFASSPGKNVIKIIVPENE